MKCQDVNKVIYKYCDGRISPRISQRVALHLNSCSRCQNMYKLTMIENEILADKADIPDISPAFTSSVINALQASGNMYTGNHTSNSKKSGFSRSNRRIWLGSMVATAAMVALLVSLPNQSLIRNGLNVFINYGSSVMDKSSPSLSGNQYEVSAGNENAQITLYDSSPTDSKAAQSEIIGKPNSTTAKATDSSQVKSSADNKATVAMNSSVATNPRNAAGDITISLRPKNIPERLKFVQVNNDMGNNTIFNYASLDGKEYLQLTMAPYSEQTAQVRSASIAPQQNTQALSRVIQNGDMKINVTLAGNLPAEELTALVNNIQF